MHSFPRAVSIMAIDLIWWRDDPVLEYACSHDVTGEELLARNREALADPRFPGLRLQLCDMERVDRFLITPAQVRAIVEIDREEALRWLGVTDPQEGP